VVFEFAQRIGINVIQIACVLGEIPETLLGCRRYALMVEGLLSFFQLQEVFCRAVNRDAVHVEIRQTR